MAINATLFKKTNGIPEAIDPGTTIEQVTGLGARLDALVEKVDGKVLSSNDFTTLLLNKLNALENYNDSALSASISSLQTQLNTLVNGSASTAIDTFNEIVSFLGTITDTTTLVGIIAGINTAILAEKNRAIAAENAIKDSLIPQSFTGVVFTNPYAANIIPRRVGDTAGNSTTLETWESVALTNDPSSWVRKSAGRYGGTLVTDFNTNNISGISTALNTSLNAPNSTENWYCLHMNSNSGVSSAVQIAIGFTTGTIYKRLKINSVYGSWQRQIESNTLNMDYLYPLSQGYYSIAGTKEKVKVTITSGITTNGTIILAGTSIAVTTDYNTATLLCAYLATQTYNGYVVSYTSGNAFFELEASEIGVVTTPTINFGSTGATGNIMEEVIGTASASSTIASNLIKEGIVVTFKTSNTTTSEFIRLNNSWVVMPDIKGSTFKGIATPTTVPGTPDGNLFYIAIEKGIYTNFSALEIIENDGLVLFTHNGSWTKNNIALATKQEVIQLGADLKPQIGTKTTINGTAGMYVESQNFNIYAGYSYRVTNTGDGIISTVQYHNSNTSEWITANLTSKSQNQYFDFTPSVNSNRIRVYFSSSSSVNIKSLNGIDYLTEYTSGLDDIKEYIEIIEGSDLTVNGTGGSWLDNINANLKAGKSYTLKNVGSGAFSTVQIYDFQASSWITVNSNTVNQDDSAIIVPTVDSVRMRVYVSSTTSIEITYNSYVSGLEKKINDLDLINNLANLSTPISASDLNSKTSFCTKVNNLFSSDYANLCLCASWCFTPLYSSDDWSVIYETINHNFRKDVCKIGMTYDRVASNINKAFTEKINRFNDARINLSTPRNFSMNTGMQADEPSAIVVDNGNKLYIYAHLKRIETIDGVNWAEPVSLILSGAVTYIMHNNINLIDGIYYMIGADSNSGGALHLFTSTDGLNFTYNGKLFDVNYDFNSGLTTTNWGNTYLVKDYATSTFYLYVEIEHSGEPWKICLATCTDILYNNPDGTIGDWSVSGYNNPIIAPSQARGYKTAGNPDFVKSIDNRPIKSNGKYYLYYHSTYNSKSNIARAYSENLINWVDEGFIFDNRDMPTTGDNTSGNADHCVIEFKGRTYLFYSWDINVVDHNPYIKYTVDDRPLNALLELRP